MAKKYDLKLKGYVGGWDFDSDYVDYFLSNKGKDKEVTVVIDSLGGSVSAAMSISASFKMHGKVNVHFVGYNASAATIASMGAKHISMDAHAMYLVHKCSTLVFEIMQANSDDVDALIARLEKEKKQLDKIDLNVAGMYSAKCKKKKAELLDLMKEGGWLTAQEAKDWGFIDEITDEPDEIPENITRDVAACMEAHGIPALPGMEKKNWLSRIMDALGKVLTDTHSNIIDKMAKLLPAICAVLGLSELTFEDGKATLTEEQCDKLETAMADLNNKIAALEASIAEKDQQIENLKNAPAAESKNVVDDSASTAISDFAQAAKEARELFNLIP